MSLALFKLESFSNAVAARVEVTYTQADLDQAFADGVAQASAQAQDDQLRALSASLEQVAAGLAADETRRRQMRQEAVDALAPILHQVLDLMAPPLSSRRLEEALQVIRPLLREGRATFHGRFAQAYDAVNVPRGQKLFLMAAPQQDMFAGMSSRTPGVLQIKGVKVEIPVVG